MASATASSTLTDASTKDAGTTVDFAAAKSQVSMILVAKGTITGGVVAVEGSHDGTNWATLEVLGPQSGVNQAFNLASGAYRYWRANILTPVTGGGTVDATFMEGN